MRWTLGRRITVLSLACIATASVYAVGVADSGDTPMSSVSDTRPQPELHVSLATYHLAVLDTASCTTSATGGEVEVVPHADGGFMFEVVSVVDPAAAHNDCRAQHLNHIELAYLDQSDNPTGETFYDAVAALEACHPEIRERIGELVQRDTDPDSLCTPPQ